MRFFIQHDTQKKLLTAENYTQLSNSACEIFGLQSNKIELLYVDPSGDGEISISNQNDFNEILTEIEELKSKGNNNKPVIIVKNQQSNQNLGNDMNPTRMADIMSITSTVCIDPVGPSEVCTDESSARNISDKNDSDKANQKAQLNNPNELQSMPTAIQPPAINPIGNQNPPPLQNMKTQFDRQAMLAEMGDIGFGGYGDNYSEFARQPSAKLEESKEEIKVEMVSGDPKEDNFDAMQKNINRASERDRALTQQRKNTQSSISSNGTVVERMPTRSDDDGNVLFEKTVLPTVENLAMSIIPGEQDDKADNDMEALRAPEEQKKIQQSPRQHEDYVVPVVDESSFGTDFSMIEPVDIHRMDSKEINVQQVMRQNQMMTGKINDLLKEKEELTSSLQQLQPLLMQMQSKIESQRQELGAKNGKMDTKNIPCFRCDGRMSERDSQDACRRCKGSGKVNTQHERCIVQLINFYVEQQLPIAIAQQKAGQAAPKAQEPDEVVMFEKNNRQRALQLIANPQIVEPVQVAGGRCDLKVTFLNENLPKNSVVKPGAKIEQIWTFKNTGDQKIPFSANLIKMKGNFGPDEIQINKTVQANGIFTVKLEDTAPDDHQHVQSEYQLYSAEGLPFSNLVKLDFIVEDAEESMMMQSLMESMDPEKFGGADEIDFNKQQPKEERMSMMINHGANAAGIGISQASALAGAAPMNPGQAQPISYAQLSQQIGNINAGKQPDPQSVAAPQALPQIGAASYGQFAVNNNSIHIAGDKSMNESYSNPGQGWQAVGQPQVPQPNPYAQQPQASQPNPYAQPVVNQPPQQPIQNYGSNPPPISAAISQPQPPSSDQYRTQLDQYFPPGSAGQHITKYRQLMIQLKEEYGYENFQTNYKVVMKFANKNQLDNLVQMFAEIDAEYNGSMVNQQAQAAAAQQPPKQVTFANQPQPVRPPPQVVPAYNQYQQFQPQPQYPNPNQQYVAANNANNPYQMAPPQPPPQAMPQSALKPNPLANVPLKKQDSLVNDKAKVKYSQEAAKIKDQKQRQCMLQLLELGYMDYKKNFALVKKHKSDINEILQRIEK